MLKELSSLTRTLYLVTLFHIPLKDREWDALVLSRTDQLFLQRLRMARVIECFNGGSLLSSDADHARRCEAIPLRGVRSGKGVY